MLFVVGFVLFCFFQVGDVTVLVHCFLRSYPLIFEFHLLIMNLFSFS